MTIEAPPLVAAPAPRGWNRPIRPVALLLFGGTVLLIWLVLMSLAVWYFYAFWEARMTMHNQAVRLRLPAGMVAMAEVTSPVRTMLDMRPVVRMPIKQTVPAQISDHLQAQVQLQTTLPVDTSVTVDRVVPVTTTLNLSVSLRSWLPSIPVTLPITLNLPLQMTVPIKTDLPIKLDLAVSGELPPVINIPIDATFTVRPRIKSVIETRMVSQTAFSLMAPIEPFPMTIERTDLRVPFSLTLLKQRSR